MRLNDDKKSQIKSQVISCQPLTDQEKNDLEKGIRHISPDITGVSYSVDPSCLGGIRIEIGDWLIDMTTKKELTELIAKLEQ